MLDPTPTALSTWATSMPPVCASPLSLPLEAVSRDSLERLVVIRGTKWPHNCFHDRPGLGLRARAVQEYRDDGRGGFLGAQPPAGGHLECRLDEAAEQVGQQFGGEVGP